MDTVEFASSMLFLSTLSLRRATTRRTYQQGEKQAFLSTLSLRRATGCLKLLATLIPISIHALLAESDEPPRVIREPANNFYPRSPCGERPLEILLPCLAIHNFYPRSPCGERQESQPPCARPTTNFYPRSPCGERRYARSNGPNFPNFYPRSPCGERQNRPRPSTGIDNFYPRSPCGERQPSSTRKLTNLMISIHALLAESDRVKSGQQRSPRNFYPRSPCGERPRPIPAVTRVANFYPRSPCGERRWRH